MIKENMFLFSPDCGFVTLGAPCNLEAAGSCTIGHIGNHSCCGKTISLAHHHHHSHHHHCQCHRHHHHHHHLSQARTRRHPGSASPVPPSCPLLVLGFCSLNSAQLMIVALKVGESRMFFFISETISQVLSPRRTTLGTILICWRKQSWYKWK